MGFFSKLISGGAATLIDAVGEAVDKNITTDEEKMALQNEEARARRDYEIEMRSLDIEEKRAYLDDKASAREAQTRVQESSEAGWLAQNVQPFLAVVLVCLTFFMFYRVLWGDLTPGSHESTITTMILGGLVGLVTQVASYYFGSSRDTENVSKKFTSFQK